MRTFWLFALLFAAAFVGCKKNSIDQTPQALLMRHAWYRYQTHYISIDTTHHTTLHDTTYLAAPCEQQEYFNFARNDSASVMAICNMYTPHILPGKWQLYADSLIFVLCPVEVPAGVPEFDLGFELSRLMEIDETHFNVFSGGYWYSLSGGGDVSVYSDAYYVTYKALVK